MSQFHFSVKWNRASILSRLHIYISQHNYATLDNTIVLDRIDISASVVLLEMHVCARARACKQYVSNRRHTLSCVSAGNLYDELITRLGRSRPRQYQISSSILYSPLPTTPLPPPRPIGVPPARILPTSTSTYAQSGNPFALACYWAAVYFGLIVTSGANDAAREGDARGGGERKKEAEGRREMEGRGGQRDVDFVTLEEFLFFFFFLFFSKRSE